MQGALKICNPDGTWITGGGSGSIATSGTGNPTLTGNLIVTGTANVQGSTLLGASSGGNAGSKLRVPVALPASSDYGVVSLGAGAWDGSTAGHFAGDGSGTLLALNTVDGTGAVFDAQVAGSSKIRLDGNGVVTMPDVQITSRLRAYQGAAYFGNLADASSAGTLMSFSTNGDNKISFFGATKVVQQLLATGAAHTVDDVITVLQAFGLCKQS
jgi:hypothetical protein